jgi:branched-chain amino acid transport system ATP-binding protein
MRGTGNYEMSISAILQMREVHTYYGESHVLQGISLDVRQGELVCLLGRNGAGKSTTIGSIIGFNPPRYGHITFRGNEITHSSPYHIAASGIGLVPQGRRIFRDLTVLENLTVVASQSKGFWTTRKVFELFPRLEERQFNRGDQLSGGEQQMLAFGRALMMNPGLILMDEPSEGLAPLIMNDISGVIRRIKDEGTAVLLVEQNLQFALLLADRCYVLNKGRIVHESSADALRQNDEVTKKYLGV